MLIPSRSIGVLMLWAVATAVAAAEPRPLGPPVNTPWVERDPWLCPDGYTLLFSSDRGGGDFDLYQTEWDGRSWSAPVRLGNAVNSEFEESRPSVSRDGQWLLFVSHRERFWRGPWMARRQGDGRWAPAVYVPAHGQSIVYNAVLGADHRRVFFEGRLPGSKQRAWMRMELDGHSGFWSRPVAFDGELPRNEVPGSFWRFSQRDGDLWYEPVPGRPADRGDLRERLVALDASSVYGRDSQLWVTEAQNLVDELEDTGWASKPGMPVQQQWVLLALAGRVRNVPGQSRIHFLRIHTGPMDWTGIDPPGRAGPGTRPARLRIAGGTRRDALRELALVALQPQAGAKAPASWQTITLDQPAYLRYLKIEVLETADPQAPLATLNEVEAYGSGESAPREVHRVGRDGQNNITVDGEPFFPIYLYNAKSDLEGVARWGFTAALATYSLQSDTARLAVLDRAHRLGLKVIAHVPIPDDEATRRLARNMVLAAKDHPALLGYLMSDESGGSEKAMKADERRAALIRQYDPHHFTALNDLYPQHYARSSRVVDVFSIDPYPGIVGRPYSYQGDAVEKAHEAVGRAKPVVVVNASWHGPGGRLCSPAENRLQTYLALIHGAKGIAWYALDFTDAGRVMSPVWDYPDHWASILRCVDEIHRLKPVLFAPDPPADSPLWKASRIDNPDARIDVMLKQLGGEVWMLAANCEPRAAAARFSFGGAERIVIREVTADRPQSWSMDRPHFNSLDPWPVPEHMQPVTEARSIEITFPPYGVRVFRMEPAGEIDSHHPPVGEGRPLAVTNESVLRRTLLEVNRLRAARQRAAAKGCVHEFWSQYGWRVSADEIGSLFDALGPGGDTDEILAGYGRLADEHPEAAGWPRWVFEVVKTLVRAGRGEEAERWFDQLKQRQPHSVWRANAEAMVKPDSVRSGRKPWTTALRADRPPAMDGDLDEPVWKHRVCFRNTVYRVSGRQPQETEFAVAYDDRALYLAARAVEPEPSKIANRRKEDDQRIWETDDVIQIYLDPGLDFFAYKLLIFNVSETKWDGVCSRLDGMDARGLDARVERKVKVTDGAWQIEVAIPYRELGVDPPRTGQAWGLGLQRLRQIGGPLPTRWGNPQGLGLDGRPENFGFLVFE